MYKKSSVPIPKPDRGSVTVKRIKGISYIYYDTHRYDKEKKRSVSISRTIGKADPDKPGMMIPNENYEIYFGSDEDDELTQSADHSDSSNMTLSEEEYDRSDDEVASDHENSIHEPDFEFRYVHDSWVVKVGCFIVINAILELLHLKETLHLVVGFGASYALFLDLVSWMIITGENTGWSYPTYARNHALFSPDMRIASDSTISEFFMSVGEDADRRFLELWNARQNHENRICVAYASTDRNGQSGHAGMADFGTTGDDPDRPVISCPVAYDLTSKVPLFYECNVGCENDISGLQDTAETLSLYGYNSISFMIDSGSVSYENIQYLDEHGFGFFLMADGMDPYVHDFVSGVRGTFESDEKSFLPLYAVYGTTVKRPLCEEDSTDRYFHVCYDPRKAEQEQRDFLDMIEVYAESFRKKTGKKVQPTEDAERYFTFTYDADGHLQSFARKNEVIKDVMEHAGYSVIVSKKKMTARDAICLSRLRDANNNLLPSDKSFFGRSSEETYYSESVETKMLIGFVALIVRSEMQGKLTEKAEKMSEMREYLTVEGAIDALEDIEIVRTSRYRYRLTCPLTKQQKTILSLFGISPAMAKRKAAEIGELLTASAKKDPRTEIGPD